MKDKNGDVSVCGGRRTRSQAAPDWTVTESLILVNEIAAVEADCSRALSSYQQWNIIAGNCAALDVGRNLGQCRRKWDSLLSEYNRIRGWESKSTRGSYWSLKSERALKLGLPENFDPELFKAIDGLVKAREARPQTELESDPEAEAGNEVLDVTVEMGSKRKRQRSKSDRYRAEKPKKCLPDESLENLSEEKDQRGCLEQRPEESHEKPEKNHLEGEYLKDFLEEKPKSKCTEERPPKGHLEMSLKSLAEVKLHENHVNEGSKTTFVEKKTISREENEEIMTLKLQELAVKIQAIGTESADYQAAGSQNVEDYHTEFTRRQGDEMIASLGNFANTLKQLCDLLQECK